MSFCDRTLACLEEFQRFSAGNTLVAAICCLIEMTSQFVQQYWLLSEIERVFRRKSLKARVIQKY